MAIEHLADNFWNIRGDFKIAHVINIGTHMSLIRKPGGTFILLDSYELDRPDREELLALTDGGALIEAVLNVHPFHTIHCQYIQKMLPHARLIGTRRHHEQAPNLDWDADRIEDEATQKQFSDILDFSIPSGVDFISDDDSVHVGSVIVRHRESGIIHVDDTLMVIDLPALVQKMVPGPKLRFHPKLADGLEKRPGAADDYIRWAKELARDWADSSIVCAAHSGLLHLDDQDFPEAISKALKQASCTLDDHRKSCG
ncbi:hypothetical protein [Sphingorhabdus sp. SMR4y]|uniref:hypothetical protein n=1 Tax=Sphingorhabdus sp. SMR4y TaxID=2584094 RepID=UPI000B61992C|nr:hypothetical protein [Sphingorhabdus sp. SMR4y]ASK87726.1 hypothetical protein SPHFLASMR4Y_00951 [Sphingorhabdus sp. SMR4y]